MLADVAPAMAEPGADATAALAQLTARRAELPATAISAARWDLLDTLGCAIAGHAADGVAAATDVLLDHGGAPQSLAWSSRSRIPAPQAAFVNAMAAHALDYDDLHPGVTHTGACVIPAAIAVAERESVDDIDDILAAIVVGAEVADRIAAAVTDGPGVSGWLLTPLCGYFGAAAAAARLAGLDVGMARDALGLAYVQTSGNGQSTLDGALAKRMQPGFAARGGVFAAELAAAGLTGPEHALEGARGFFAVYHRGRYDAAALHGSGRWLIERATYKRYPCCGWTHAAIECAAALGRDGVRADDVTFVKVGVNGQAFRSVGTPLPHRYRPRSVVDAQFSIPYTFATALLHGTVTLEDFSESALSRPDVRALAERVHVHVDEELEAQCGREISPAHVTVTARDGTTAHADAGSPVSDAADALLGDALAEKFTACCRAAGWPPTRARELCDLILGGAGAGSASALYELMERPR